uniref:Nucleocapsid protein n=1 Tax=Coleopteran orthomyxo-related virus OKIAV184 TaxID=2746264 RepID=A0A7D7J1H2_9ORTO|nr:nucleocapsid protein [Coleopteran orthomyxo-related virus OKIAV184]
MATPQSIDMDVPMQTTPEVRKRKANEFQNVDLDTGEDLPNPKRRTLELNEGIKIQALKAMLAGYRNLKLAILGADNDKNPEYCYNISISNQITSIMMTLHNIRRQRVNRPGEVPTLESKARLRSFKVSYKGDFSISFDSAMKNWENAIREAGLEYKKFEQGSNENWIGTMSPYLSYHAGFQLRMKELRMGHGKIITGKTAEGGIQGTPISSMGLNGSHHILLEGISYNPERRTAMVQSLGPMTVFIQMLRTKDAKYRKKWEDAVKSQMGSISCIDDIITTSRSTKRVTDFAPITTLLAEILLISTCKQVKRMFFPIAMLYEVFIKKSTEEGLGFLKRFNVSSHGGFELYNEACKYKWWINGDMEDTQAAQIVFHSLFGTFGEDLGILEQITESQRWYTREELGSAFKQSSSEGISRSFNLIKMKCYSKLASSNQNTALAGVYEQVTYIPVFSGFRDHKFSDDFFDHIQKQTVKQTTGKTIAQIETALSEILLDLRKMAQDGHLDRVWGTVNWFDMKTVSTNSSKDQKGSMPGFLVQARNKFFMSKSSR